MFKEKRKFQDLKYDTGLDNFSINGSYIVYML